MIIKIEKLNKIFQKSTVKIHKKYDQTQSRPSRPKGGQCEEWMQF